MEPTPSPTIASFLIRFIQEQADSPAHVCHYRGMIRHIQNDEEIAFTSWEEAVQFIQNIFPIHCLGEEETAVNEAALRQAEHLPPSTNP